MESCSRADEYIQFLHLGWIQARQAICVAEILQKSQMTTAFIREMRSVHSDMHMQVLSNRIRVTPKSAAQQ